MINSHAKRLAIPAKILRVDYGWDFYRLLADAQRAFEHICPYCDKPIKAMRRGLEELTLDIVDRDDRPFYITNTKWICFTCNRQKKTTPASEWAAKRAWYDVWKRQPKPSPIPVQPKLIFG